MAWVDPTARSDGYTVPASEWNQNTVENPSVLREGGIAIASQAEGDVITATDSDQLGRVAPGTAGMVLTSNGAGQQPSFKLGGTVVVALVDGASVAIDASLGNRFTLTATDNRTIAVPTNPTAGQAIVILHTASGADRTLSLTTGSAGAFRFGTDIPDLTATASGQTDYIGCIYNSGASRWDVVGYVKGY